MFVITIVLLVANGLLYAGSELTQLELIMSYVRYIVPTFLLPILTGVLVMKLDKRPIKPMIKGLLCYPLFLGSWLAINFKCLFKRDTTWEKIAHTRNVTINEMATEEVRR